MVERLQHMLTDIIHGRMNLFYTVENISMIQNETLRLLGNRRWNSMDIAVVQLILKMCQIIYNNSDAMCPLEDGVYDQLLEVYKQFDPLHYPVGAEPLDINNDNRLPPSGDGSGEIKNPIIFVDPSVHDGLFYDDLMRQTEFDTRLYDRKIDRTKYVPNTSSRPNDMIVPHKYPKLVGTLTKCKFVLMKEAIEAGVANDPAVIVFERDFLGKQLINGLFSRNDNIILLLELKYDGMSVEADVTNKVMSACSRGDTDADKAQDLSIVLKDYPFFQCPPIKDEESFGMKFEAIITKANLEKMSMLRGRPYKNGRNGIIGLFGSTDAQAYQDLITLVPLETSLDIDPISEVGFMNKYYTSGVPLVHAVVSGTYEQVLFQVYKFVKEAEAIRPIMPYMYDGVVIHHVDPTIRKILGRQNSVNQYSIAVKFNPTVKEAIFLGYTFTVGQNGVITPMIHYTPVEFFGTIHTKSSGHSYERFRELNLSVGEVINVTYMNDVMPYVSRPLTPEVEFIKPSAGKVPFPNTCPCCGSQLFFSPSGKSARCTNMKCPDRAVARLTNMLDKLGIKGFSEAAIRSLNILSFKDLLSVDIHRASILGDTSAMNFMATIDEFKKKPIYDYIVVGALGFENVAQGTWKKILCEIHIHDIVYLNASTLFTRLLFIKGIGNAAASAIVGQRNDFYEDLVAIISMPNVVCSFHMAKRKTIRFTGVRDSALEAKLQSMGYDANSKASVTKSTDILLVPHVGFDSEKMKKRGVNTVVVPIDEFAKNLEYYLSM